jgi:hypothetical protein
MALSTLYQLDPVNASSNSNYSGADIQELCAPSNLNNALRALGQMVTQQLCYQSAAISASVSTNIATASTGLYIPIVGAGAINSFGVVPGEQASAAVLRILEFSSSASLSHGSALILRSGASRRTQPGDVGMYIHEGSSDRWRELFYSSAGGFIEASSISATELRAVECGLDSISATTITANTLSANSASVTSIAFTTLQATSISASVGKFGVLNYAGTDVANLYIQAASTSSAASASTSSNIPFDTSAPANSEGENLFSLSFTPKNATSVLEIEALVWLGDQSGSAPAIISLFRANGATAVAAASMEGVSTNVAPLQLYYEESASTTNARVYALRYGAESGSIKINHGAGGNLGGTLRSWLRVRERL